MGYPVPIPVDTPLPFDGFRTYAGLHMRHQDLMAATPWVHQETVGQTHYGRAIYAYRLGDDDLLTVEGLPEPAMLTNGGIHAREWQSPETVTGIMELLALHEEDHHLYDYLRDNVNMIVIPSLNIDGFMQTQKFPTENYLGVDPSYPESSPRDGRMRRKNMLDVDEHLYTLGDLMRGVDLNRNNDPFWNTNPERSSSNVLSLVYHGIAPASEPETQALDAAAQLGPSDRLRIYTDVHSFSQVHFWGRNRNTRLTAQTEEVLGTFSNHHNAFDASKWYAYADRNSVAQNSGIGTTEEYFLHTYQVPSWTLEIEPSGGQDFHSPLPGGGADYGGTGENGHDGFILPESEITRVREELAQTFAAVYYRQAGPPAINTLRMLDSETDAVVFEAQWDTVNNQTRSLYSKQLRPLKLDHSYHVWMSFNKPMRWRVDGEVVPFPGQPANTLDLEADLLVGESSLTTILEAGDWLNQPGEAPDGFMNYRDDALKLTFRFASDELNLGLVNGVTDVTMMLETSDMTGMATDANPA
ncbi:MAG: M14 family zinc carboxypeptidase, partial [Xanthomonadales bacterium]|nr:M14 family zinc carboxypeptidase [Xanthomonadales bacterium]